MLTELLGKGGNLCSQARSGAIRCPLIVRPTSEDAITGELFGALGHINPRWWLPDLLNAGLGAERFRRRVFRGLRIRLWVNQPRYPPELLPYREGSTQVDVVITFENPPTTVFVEMKYRSGLSSGVSGDGGTSGFPSDQLVRNIRVGLHQAGYLREDDALFARPRRDFVVLVIAPAAGDPLVARYRDEGRLREAIPHADRLVALPRGPFVGALDYGEIVDLLRRQSRWLAPAERRVASGLGDYLGFKLSSRADPDPRPAVAGTLPLADPAVA